MSKVKTFHYIVPLLPGNSSSRRIEVNVPFGVIHIFEIDMASKTNLFIN